MGLRFGDILVILILALLLFGPGKLPQMAKLWGESLNEFKKAASPDPPGQPVQNQPALAAVAPEKTTARRARKSPG